MARTCFVIPRARTICSSFTECVRSDAPPRPSALAVESAVPASNVERIFAVAAFLVFEEIKIGGAGGSGHVMAGHADESAGEIRHAGCGGFVREDAGVELLGEPAPVLVYSFDAVGLMEAFEINFHAQMN